MPSPNVIAAARLLREEGYAVVKLEWSPEMATAGEEALAASEHLPEEDAAAHVEGVVANRDVVGVRQRHEHLAVLH